MDRAKKHSNTAPSRDALEDREVRCWVCNTVEGEIVAVNIGRKGPEEWVWAHDFWVGCPVWVEPPKG